jgi:hypothetical protein
MRDLKTGSKQPSWFREHVAELLLVVGGLTFANLIFIAKAFRGSNTIDPENAARLGSFVGGYVGSLFALVGVVLLIATLKAQRLASSQQNFETKYFELLKMHRDNVAEAGMKGKIRKKTLCLVDP